MDLMKQGNAAAEKEIDEKRAAFEKERGEFEAQNREALDRLERQGRRSIDGTDECAFYINHCFCMFHRFVILSCF